MAVLVILSGKPFRNADGARGLNGATPMHHNVPLGPQIADWRARESPQMTPVHANIYFVLLIDSLTALHDLVLRIQIR